MHQREPKAKKPKPSQHLKVFIVGRGKKKVLKRKIKRETFLICSLWGWNVIKLLSQFNCSWDKESVPWTFPHCLELKYLRLMAQKCLQSKGSDCFFHWWLNQTNKQTKKKLHNWSFSVSKLGFCGPQWPKGVFCTLGKKHHLVLKISWEIHRSCLSILLNSLLDLAIGI